MNDEEISTSAADSKLIDKVGRAPLECGNTGRQGREGSGRRGMTRHLIVKNILVHAEDTGCPPREWTTQWRDAANWDPKAAIRCLREMAEDIPPEYSVRVTTDFEED